MNYINIPGSANEFFVLFHGTGGNEYSLLSIVGDIDPAASVISFLGNVGSGSNRRFFAPLQDGQLEREDFDHRVDQFLTLWDGLKPENAKVTFVGYSNGANFVLGLLEKAVDIADNIVLMHPSNLGYTFKKGSKSRVLITTGATDTLSLPSDVLQLSKQLSEDFLTTKLELLDGGHEVGNEEVAKIINFLDYDTPE